jgi:hypothetical protein
LGRGLGDSMNEQVEKWTNPSVKKLAGKDDPVRTITQRAREVVLTAMDKGWSGPPFDPLALSDLLNLRTAPEPTSAMRGPYPKETGCA